MANNCRAFRMWCRLALVVVFISQYCHGFSPLSDVRPVRLLSHSLQRIGESLAKQRGSAAKTQAQVQAEQVAVKSVETSRKIQCSDGKCTMFRPDPEIRKLMITYLQHKLAHEVEQGKIHCTRERLRTIVASISPPVEPSLLDKEVENILLKLAGNCAVEERDFITSALLDNGVWKEVGETVVKELVYLDNLNHEEQQGFSILSDTCLSKLESSLNEDGSSIAKFSKSDASLACKIFKILNTPHEALLVTNSALPARIPFFADVDKFEPYDLCGNPSLMMLTAERLKHYTSPFSCATTPQVAA